MPIKKPKSSIPKRVRLMTPVRLVGTHADGAEGSGPRRAQFHASRRRRFGHRGRRLRFSRPDVHGYITVMKGAKRDVGREIKVPMYSATYSGKGIGYQTTVRVAEQRRNDVA